MPDEVKECRYSCSLNLNKYRVLYKVYSLIWNCQHTSPVFSTDSELSNILRVCICVVVHVCVCVCVCCARVCVCCARVCVCCARVCACVCVCVLCTCVHVDAHHILIFLSQAAVMQMQMSEAELSDLSHTREPSSKKGTDKHNSRVSSYNDWVLINNMINPIQSMV